MQPTIDRSPIISNNIRSSHTGFRRIPLKTIRHHILCAFYPFWMQIYLRIAIVCVHQWLLATPLKILICLSKHHWDQSWHLPNAKLFFSEKKKNTSITFIFLNYSCKNFKSTNKTPLPAYKHLATTYVNMF